MRANCSAEYGICCNHTQLLLNSLVKENKTLIRENDYFFLDKYNFLNKYNYMILLQQFTKRVV